MERRSADYWLLSVASVLVGLATQLGRRGQEAQSIDWPLKPTETSG